MAIRTRHDMGAHNDLSTRLGLLRCPVEFRASRRGVRHADLPFSAGFVASVVIDDFDIGGSFRAPSEANAVLVVDSNTVLSLSAAARRFEPVSPNRKEVLNRSCRIEPEKPSAPLILDRGKLFDSFAIESASRLRPDADSF